MARKLIDRPVVFVALASLSGVALLGALAAVGPQSVPKVIKVDQWVLARKSWPVSCCWVARRVVVALEGSKGVLVLNEAGDPVATVPTTSTPVLLEADATTERVFVSTTDGIDVLDAARIQLTGHVAIPSLIYGIALDVEQSVGYACDGKDPVLHSFDLGTLKVTGQISLSGVGFKPVLAPSLKKVYVGSAATPDPASPLLSGGAVDVVDLVAGRVAKSIAVPGMTVRAIATGGGQYLYVVANMQGHLVRIDTRADSIDPQFGLFVGRANDIVIDARQESAYVTCEGADEEMVVIDLARCTEIARFHAGEGFMAPVRDDFGTVLRLFVPNFKRDALAVIDTSEVWAHRQ